MLKNKKRSDNYYETKKKIRKEAAELFAHAGDGFRAVAGDESEGVCSTGGDSAYNDYPYRHRHL